MAFSGDGRTLATQDVQVRIRELATGQERLAFALPPGMTSLAYSQDGRFLACGQYDGNVRVYGTASGRELVMLESKQGSINSLAFSRDSRLLASSGANTTVLVWKMPANEGLPATLTETEAAVLWQTLGDTEASRANRAVGGLVAVPKRAIAIIKERFRGKRQPPDPEQIAKLIADLDDDAFKVRERATRELTAIGPNAAEALRQALTEMPSEEARRRIEELLRRLGKGGDPDRLRALRAIEVLERIGTPAAKDLLRELARKSLSVELDDEVHASLERLGVKR
jgi:hypothetical protein